MNGLDTIESRPSDTIENPTDIPPMVEICLTHTEAEALEAAARELGIGTERISTEVFYTEEAKRVAQAFLDMQNSQHFKAEPRNHKSFSGSFDYTGRRFFDDELPPRNFSRLDAVTLFMGMHSDLDDTSAEKRTESIIFHGYINDDRDKEPVDPQRVRSLARQIMVERNITQRDKILDDETAERLYRAGTNRWRLPARLSILSDSNYSIEDPTKRRKGIQAIIDDRTGRCIVAQLSDLRGARPSIARQIFERALKEVQDVGDLPLGPRFTDGFKAEVELFLDGMQPN